MAADPSTPDMRRVVLDAALAVLDRDGAAGLTVRAIAAEAGCSTTGVYTYFGGKHGLVEAIFVEGFASFGETLAARYADNDLLAAGRAYRRWALAHPTHYMVMFGRAVPDFVPGDEAIVTGQATFQELVDAVAASGVGDPIGAAYRLFATVHGYVMLELAGMGPVEPDLLEAFYEAGLRGCLPIDA